MPSLIVCPSLHQTQILTNHYKVGISSCIDPGRCKFLGRLIASPDSTCPPYPSSPDHGDLSAILTYTSENVLPEIMVARTKCYTPSVPLYAIEGKFYTKQAFRGSSFYAGCFIKVFGSKNCDYRTERATISLASAGELYTTGCQKTSIQPGQSFQMSCVDAFS